MLPLGLLPKNIRQAGKAVSGYAGTPVFLEGLPIGDAFGSHWAYDTFKTSGMRGVYARQSANVDLTLILSDVVVQPGRVCAIKTQDQDLIAVCSEEGVDDRSRLDYVNEVLFKSLSEDVIFFGERRAGSEYSRCS